MTQLGLGCASLGMPYGNSDRLMPEDEALEILRYAHDAGIRYFDSAESYGRAMDLLVAAYTDAWCYTNIVTKTTFGDIHPLADTVLAHDPRIVFDEGFSKFAETIVGYELKFGVSVYSLEEAQAALECGHVTEIQAPVNLLDRRFIEPSFVAKCKAKGVRLIARSILLQGVLTDDQLPNVYKQPRLNELRGLLPDVDTMYDAFRYIFGNLKDVVEVAVVGVQSLGQLKEVIQLAKMAEVDPLPPEHLQHYDEALAFATEHKLYDPRTWNL